MLVVLSEAASVDQHTVNGRELHSITETARLFGCRVIALPANIRNVEDAENAFAYISAYPAPQLALWVGYIPPPERYQAVYAVAYQRNLYLVNTPEQYQTAMEFDRFYPLLGALTPASRVITAAAEAPAAAATLGYPIFVKGAVKSAKEHGWSAVVAANEAELVPLVERTLAADARARGRVILRTIAPLRRITTDFQDFPLGREYRVFVYNGRVLAYGFYWDEHADAFTPTAVEDAAIRALAIEAAQRVGTPFIAVDVAQLEDRSWIVIEVGDGQFSGLSQVPVLELWSQLSML